MLILAIVRVLIQYGAFAANNSLFGIADRDALFRRVAVGGLALALMGGAVNWIDPASQIGEYWRLGAVAAITGFVLVWLRHSKAEDAEV